MNIIDDHKKEDFTGRLLLGINLIKKYYGLELKLSEQIEFKKYFTKAYNVYQNSIQNRIEPTIETMYIFMNKNYKTQINSIIDENSFFRLLKEINKDINKKYKFENYSHTWFQQQQEKMFKP